MPPTEATLRAIKQYQPEVFLLSGGGTDIAGSELASYLNHKSSTLLVLPEDYVQYASSTAAQRAYTMDPEDFFGPLGQIDTSKRLAWPCGVCGIE
jgi:hypothetical protein